MNLALVITAVGAAAFLFRLATDVRRRNPHLSPKGIFMADARHPLMDNFKSLGSTLAFIGSVATAAVGWGVITASQGDALQGLLGAIPGVVALVSSLLTAFGVVKAGEAKVTPVEDPRDAAGRPLVVKAD